ncbi:unnamed protein product, partial [Mesorhabditis belari]|uniref:Uncharacterized protein n=1 Tax=Mesorhabditis belari TaxID=2138241 RepID=A0AAF3EIB0_9BILA
MTLEYQSEGVWLRTQVVDFCVQFIDMAKFAAFVSKLSDIAGYQQLVVSDGDVSTEMEEEIDVFEQEDFEHGANEYISMRPRFSVFEDLTQLFMDASTRDAGALEAKRTIRGCLRSGLVHRIQRRAA